MDYNYRLTLLNLFEERRSSNKSYSLRAFAKACGLSATTISQVLSGKRPLSFKAALRICDRLNLSPENRNSLIRSFKANATADRKCTANQTEQIEIDKFKLVSDWHHYAILSLCELKNNKSEPEWIAETLGITKSQAKDALNRLQKLGLLVQENNKLMQMSKPLTTPNDTPSAAVRKHHRQNLERAAGALEEIPMEWREFGSMTLAIDPQKLPEAKDAIRVFRQQLATLCESKDPKIVYNLCVQLFPVNHPDKFKITKE